MPWMTNRYQLSNGRCRIRYDVSIVWSIRQFTAKTVAPWQRRGMCSSTAVTFWHNSAVRCNMVVYGTHAVWYIALIGSGQRSSTLAVTCLLWPLAMQQILCYSSPHKMLQLTVPVLLLINGCWTWWIYLRWKEPAALTAEKRFSGDKEWVVWHMHWLTVVMMPVPSLAVEPQHKLLVSRAVPGTRPHELRFLQFVPKVVGWCPLIDIRYMILLSSCCCDAQQQCRYSCMSSA